VQSSVTSAVRLRASTQLTDHPLQTRDAGRGDREPVLARPVQSVHQCVRLVQEVECRAELPMKVRQFGRLQGEESSGSVSCAGQPCARTAVACAPFLRRSLRRGSGSQPRAASSGASAPKRFAAGWCRGRDSNPHGRCRPAAFKAAASAIPPPPRCAASWPNTNAAQRTFSRRWWGRAPQPLSRTRWWPSVRRSTASRWSRRPCNGLVRTGLRLWRFRAETCEASARCRR
jgi:hypothetical protein